MKKGSRKVDFYGRGFNIAPDVLIPRPETEMMVDAVMNLVGKAYLPGVKPSKAKLPQDCRILDVGTGSGCIAVTLALELPRAKVMAVDVSNAALQLAKRNAKKHGVQNIEIFYSDLISNATFRPDLREKLMINFTRHNIPVSIQDRSKIDIVVANLPYVDENWDWIDKEALSAEPALALYAKDGGLALIKKLIQQASERNVPYLILEADPCQHERIISFATKHNYSLLETRGFCLVFSRGSRLAGR